MVKNETRHEQYLRILTSGPNGESDYEAIKYLVDKGYTDSKYVESKAIGNYGKVIKAYWLGANSFGID